MLYLFNEQFGVFFICIGGIFFCAGSRVVSSVLLSNKLYGKVNAQLLVPLYFSSDVFGILLKD